MVTAAVYGDRVVVTIEGSGDLQPMRSLANQLANTLQRPVEVYLRTVPSQIEVSSEASQ